MQLHAVVSVPEDAVRATVLEVVPALLAATVPPEPEDTGRGLLSRWRRRPPEPTAPVASFTPAAAETVSVKIAKFGNVTADVASDLTAAFEDVAVDWRAPVLRVSRVTVAAEAPYDLTAELEGDVDALRDIYRNVIEIAAMHRFYLDRRNFRGEVVLGQLSVSDGGALPEQVAGLELDHVGPWWSAPHLTLLRASFSGGAGFAEVARIGLDDDPGEAEVLHLA